VATAPPSPTIATPVRAPSMWSCGVHSTGMKSFLSSGVLLRRAPEVVAGGAVLVGGVFAHRSDQHARPRPIARLETDSQRFDAGRFTGTRFDIVTVADSREQITTMGGLRMVPDALLADLDPAVSDLLVLPGALMWDAGGGDTFAAAAGRFLDAGVPVAAICGATAGLARAGLLDERNHTSAAAEYLAATGYAGGDHYVDERAVIDGDLVTAGPQSPVQFARATLGRLRLASDHTLDAYEGVFHRGDPRGFPVLMQAQGAI
ncbi:MAG: DJ-1/PfpI family protein, partial [Pseudonocardia sp.]